MNVWSNVNVNKQRNSSRNVNNVEMDFKCLSVECVLAFTRLNIYTDLVKSQKKNSRSTRALTRISIAL